MKAPTLFKRILLLLKVSRREQPCFQELVVLSFGVYRPSWVRFRPRQPYLERRTRPVFWVTSPILEGPYTLLLWN